MQGKHTALVAETGGPRARREDPDTSHQAAEGSDLAGSQLVVEALLNYAGPTGLTDEELFEGSRADWVVALTGHAYSPSRLRTARSELVSEGTVADAQILRFTEFGRVSKVWVLALFMNEATA